jgi:hypothetical protein
MPVEVARYLKSNIVASEPSLSLYWLEYKKFLLMCHISRNNVSPSAQVDHVWHAHQICFMRYKDDCMKLFGKVIMHSPSTGGEENDTEMALVKHQTDEFYKIAFNNPMPQSAWGRYRCCQVRVNLEQAATAITSETVEGSFAQAFNSIYTDCNEFGDSRPDCDGDCKKCGNRGC